ncbi:tyrosine recombinase XerC [Clostridium scatologenes]|uniref:Integrase family protein n=1 Tax=Clostridium scatologenes TaxID=1548 RepID=A0A0E3JY46_CLOSL|nr:tyrosine recombinase XerC [Clostridium scatologenes]AKA68580.1 integrase family protein [Clostridium scatologenes]
MKYNIASIRNNTLPQSLIDFSNYLETIKGKSQNTIKGYKIDLTMFFRFLKIYKGLINDETLDFEEIPIADIDNSILRKITLADLYAFLSFVEKYRKNSAYARARKVATLKSFFKFLSSRAKVIDENPAVDLESPKISKRNPTYLTLDESKSLLKAISGRNKERDYCIITLFLNCGLRLSELCSINISNIKGDILTVIGKGNKERTVYLNNACVKALNNYLKVRNENIDKIIDKDVLFISKNHTKMSKRAVEVMLKKHLISAELDSERYTPHKLRHTAATLMYKYGNVDIRSLQKILGHENVSTTQIYTHVDDEKLRDAVKLNPLSQENDE